MNEKSGTHLLLATDLLILVMGPAQLLIGGGAGGGTSIDGLLGLKLMEMMDVKRKKKKKKKK